MQEEEPVVDIHVAYGRTGLVVGCQVGQFIVVAERLALMTGADSSGDIEFLLRYVVPDTVYGLDIG